MTWDSVSRSVPLSPRCLELPLYFFVCQFSCFFSSGVPFNIASYSLLTRMMAQVCGLRAGEFVHTLGLLLFSNSPTASASSSFWNSDPSLCFHRIPLLLSLFPLISLALDLVFSILFSFLLCFYLGTFLSCSLPLGDAHVYVTHIKPLQEQLQRQPRPFPTLHLNPSITNINDFTFADLEIRSYNPYGKISMEMAV